MMTLNDLLEITDVGTLTVYAQVTPRLKARIDVNAENSAELDDLSFHYGGARVRRVSPVFRGDARMVVELGDRE